MGLIPWEGTKLGPQFDREGGDALNKWLMEHKLPALTGLVVNRDSSTPGGQYFTSNGRQKEDYEWWMAEMRKAPSIVWSDYV